MNGGSNGGLLVAATANQVGNSLFAGACAEVGVMDMLRFHMFTIGMAWVGDYGKREIKEDVLCQLTYSPYHNVNKTKEFQYPAMLLITSERDDRVVPLHSIKLAAELQYWNGATNKSPLLFRHHLNTGHGGGKPISMTIAEATEKFVFYMKTTNTNFISS